jgi:hypothetical protein
VSAIQNKNKFVDGAELEEVGWKEVSKTTKGGPDIDDFVTHYEK